MSQPINVPRLVARSPLLWGGLATVAFYGPIQAGVLTDPFVIRYFAGHWVEYIEGAAFFVALAALIIKAFDVATQSTFVGRAILEPVPTGGQSISDCGQLQSRMSELPASRQDSYLFRRLHDALEHVRRNSSAESLDAELKYLSDMDAARAHQSYALVRIIIWAIPILGFLGTVIGITIAIASLSPQALEGSLPEVIAGLGVAFDTTALALGLSMVLMFVQYLTDRAETRLLSAVDDQVAAELVGRFQVHGSGTDPQLATVRRMIEAVVQSTEKLLARQTEATAQLVARQAEIWKAALESGQTRFNQLTEASNKNLETAVASALDRSLKEHVTQMAAAEQAAAEQNRRHWSQVRQALAQKPSVPPGHAA